MKKVFKIALIISIIIVLISIVYTIAAKREYNDRLAESAVRVQYGQYSYSSLYGEMNSLLEQDKKVKTFYVLDVISGFAVLTSAIGLHVTTKKEREQIQED